MVENLTDRFPITPDNPRTYTGILLIPLLSFFQKMFIFVSQNAIIKIYRILNKFLDFIREEDYNEHS